MISSLLGLIIPTVKTPAQFNSLKMDLYIFGSIAGVVFLILSAVISVSIKYEGGSDRKDITKRRMVYWSLLFAVFATNFMYNKFKVEPTIALNLQSKFMTLNLISSLIALLVYLILGQVLAMMFSTGKLGNWKLLGR